MGKWEDGLFLSLLILLSFIIMFVSTIKKGSWLGQIGMLYFS